MTIEEFILTLFVIFLVLAFLPLMLLTLLEIYDLLYERILNRKEWNFLEDDEY